MGSVTILEVEECWTLLASAPVGRVAVNRRGAGPLVVPVNFVVDDRTIVFRSEHGTKVERISRGAIAFQADHVLPRSRTGWSVLVDGLAHEIDPNADPATSVDPWLPRPPGRAVRIVPTTITGRLLLQ